LAYIYKIVNDINDKVYIGKTRSSLKERFRQHRQDHQKARCWERPLYRAMRKYGFEHFRIELIEETDFPEEREIFWIDYYDAYYSGYNGTKGGDGKPRLDYDLIVRTYEEIHNVKETAKIVKASKDQVSAVLKSRGIEIKSGHQILKEKLGKTVVMKSFETGEIIMTFQSNKDAARYLKNEYNLKAQPISIASHIADVCNGKRHGVCGFDWAYL
jgi:group I intron endonuclease